MKSTAYIFFAVCILLGSCKKDSTYKLWVKLRKGF